MHKNTCFLLAVCGITYTTAFLFFSPFYYLISKVSHESRVTSHESRVLGIEMVLRTQSRDCQLRRCPPLPTTIQHCPQSA